MATVTAYWRPTSIAEVIDLLDRPDTVLIGGGTTFNERLRPAVVEVAVVDLQAAGLAGIGVADDGRVFIGATTPLDDVAGDDRVPDVVRDAARRELPSTLRRQATVGGCVAGAHWESELLAALLAHDAIAEVADRAGTAEVELADLLGRRERISHRLITGVTIATTGSAAAARTARTPADRPIVAAVARRADGRIRVALSGVAATPAVVDDPSTLHPPGDFRGSADYRRALATTLFARVTEALS